MNEPGCSGPVTSAGLSCTGGGAGASAGQERRRTRFLRRPTWLCRLLAVPFLGACAGAVVLAALYHWPRANVPVYYFTVRPAFVWFGALAPLLLTGTVAVKVRWFLLGGLVWFVGLASVEELVPLVRWGEANSREAFLSAQMGLRSHMARGQGASVGQRVPLRVVTWNVHGASRLPQCFEQLAGLEPDIVCLQECRLSSLRAAIQVSGRFAAYHTAEGPGYQALLSRFPVELVAMHGPALRRATTWRLELLPGIEIFCMNVHLSPVAIKAQLVRGWSWQGLREAVNRTARELQQMRGDLLSVGAPEAVILAGDFNLPPHYAGLKKATAGLKECFRAGGYGWGKTAPAKVPAVRVDMIFVPEDAHVYYAAAIPTEHSDHYMMLAEVVLPALRVAEAQDEIGARSRKDSR